MDVQVLVMALLSLTVAVVGAVFIGRFFTPRLESRKVAAVAESEEAAVFAHISICWLSTSVWPTPTRQWLAVTSNQRKMPTRC